MTWAEGLAFLISAMSWIGPGLAQCPAEVADWRGGGSLATELLQGQPPPRSGDLQPVSKPRSHQGLSSLIDLSIIPTIRPKYVHEHVVGTD